MRRPVGNTIEVPGQDSFLDIMANIVGVLIILVMVVGARTRDVWIEAAEADRDEPVETSQPIDIAGPRSESLAIEADIRRLDAQLHRVRAEMERQFTGRDQLQDMVTLLEQRLAERREQLDEDARREYDLARALAAQQRELVDLTGLRNALDRENDEPIVLEHLPTPLAKTVFGKEEHFRLSAGRLVHVPLNTLVDKLKSEARQKLWKLKDAAQITETIGPVEGFLLKYELRRVVRLEQTGVGPVGRATVELAGFELMPVSGDMGEPFDAALRPGSEFARRLAGMSPDATTITVWTYPDSFGQFRRLQAELFRRGFLTAGRPLPEGYPISGSPSGSRSAAQ